MLTDGSERAFDRVMKCACQHGGNAIVLVKHKDAGFQSEDAGGMYTFTNTGKVYEATVIRMK
jgi:hypothetical protein